MEARFIYRNRSNVGFYDASTRKMRGGPDKVIVYVNGVLCAMDRKARIIIPASRWKLMEIGVACFLAALKPSGAASSSLESEPVRELPQAHPETADEYLSIGDDEWASPEAFHQEHPEAQWERLIEEMQNLSR
jgi:hypothetical protein